MQIVYSLLALLALFGCVRQIVRAPRTGTGSTGRLLAAAAAGVFVFLLLQSAIERRFVLSLFLPFEAGAFRPGRWAVLFLSLLLCLRLALTERGRRFLARLTALTSKRGGRWLASLVVTGLFFAWTLRVNVLCYMTNDDITILRTIAAIPERGLGAAAGAWSNVLFCAFISLFYRIAPNGYWYLGYHLVMLLVSLVIVGRCLLLKLERAGLSPLVGCAVHAALCIGLFSYTFGALSFTVTPAVVGTAAIALVLCRENEASLVSLIAADAGSALLMFLCRLQRMATLRAVVCFWALAVVYTLVRTLLRRGPGWKKSLAVLVPGAALTLVLCFANLSSSLPSASYEDSNAEYYRSIVTDYLMNDLTDEQWESAGIPPELGLMIRGWYFMDERVNTDTFRRLTELYYDGSGAGTSDLSHLVGTNSLREAAVILRGQMLPSAAAIGVMALLACYLGFCSLRRRWLELLAALGAAGGAALLCAYLIWQGRFPLRAYLVVAIPATVLLLLLLLSFPPAEAGERTRSARRVVTGAAAGAVFLCFCLSAMGSPRADAALSRADLFGEQWAIETHCAENADVFFYTNMTAQNLDPIHSAYTYPSNISLWGGSYFTTVEHSNADVFFQDGIRLMYRPLSTLSAFLQYLTLDFGPVQAVTTARLTQGIAVADLDRIDPGGAYTGWYEQNGYTYYFENGQAVTGTRVIDGTTYAFTPAGAASSMTVVQTDDGTLLYTTDAYSLMTPGE